MFNTNHPLFDLYIQASQSADRVAADRLRVHPFGVVLHEHRVDKQVVCSASEPRISRVLRWRNAGPFLAPQPCC